MDYVIYFEDGTTVSSQETTWLKLKNDNRNIVKIDLYDMLDEKYELVDYDFWFFTDIGITRSSAESNAWVGRLIGGYNTNGIGKLIYISAKPTETGYAGTKVIELKAKDFEQLTKIYSKDCFKINHEI